jgi:hypothetical protein
VKVPNWQTGALTDVAQTVQRSAFPLAYGAHEAAATALGANLAEGGPGFICH